MMDDLKKTGVGYKDGDSSAGGSSDSAKPLVVTYKKKPREWHRNADDPFWQPGRQESS